jgi:molybdenum cofactor cytidylyltransferase
VAFVAGLVLAAGGSARLGQPKQLLPYRGSTLLGATVSFARQCRFDQLLVTLGGSASQVREAVDLRDVEVVDNPQYGSGCSSSIAAALRVVDSRATGLVLLLGDQPGVSVRVVEDLVGRAGSSAIGVCRYSDGLGHPFWFGREVFPDLLELHGDKAVWKLVESGRHAVTELDVAEPLPLDVDTWDDYQALLARDTARMDA